MTVNPLPPGTTLALGADKSGWSKEVAELIAKNEGLSAGAVSAKPLGGGFSNDADGIFAVDLDGERFVLKVFRDSAGAAAESAMLSLVAGTGLRSPVPLAVMGARLGAAARSA